MTDNTRSIHVHSKLPVPPDGFAEVRVDVDHATMTDAQRGFVLELVRLTSRYAAEAGACRTCADLSLFTVSRTDLADALYLPDPDATQGEAEYRERARQSAADRLREELRMSS